MLTKYYRPLIAFVAAAHAMICFAGDDLPPAKEPITPVRGLSSFGTILVKGQNPVVDDSGTARFDVRMDTAMKAAYPTSSMLAVVFDDAMMNGDSVQCPVININGRPRKIQETQPNVMTIEANVTPEEKRNQFVIINPRIIETSGRVDSEEGCLSLPGVGGALFKRFAKVTVEAMNEKGFSFTLKGDGLLARCLQHEIDHLDGKMIINRAPLRQQLRMKWAIHKLKKEDLW